MHTDTRALRPDRQFDANGLVRRYLKQVDVDDPVCYGVELNVLEHAVVRFSINLELEKVRFRCNDQLVQLDFAHVKVNLLGATIHHTRDLALIAEYSCVLFPYAPSWGAAQ